MSGPLRRRYRLDDPGHLLLLADRTLALRHLLTDVGAFPLGGRRVLDVGCGAGDSLATLLAAGGPADVTGIDRDEARLLAAGDRIRPGHFETGDGAALRFDSGSFDVVLLFTVLSSVRDDRERQAIAVETRRVLRPGGAVLVYDFSVNPTNSSTRGLSERDVRVLFDSCTYESRRVTPLPALARRLARSGKPRTWLSRLPVPRTHHLTWISVP